MSEMAIFANKTLHKMIEESKCDYNIDFGLLNLKCQGVGKTFDARYRNSIAKKVDGLHFFGPRGMKDYSESLVNILIESLKKPKSSVSSFNLEIDPSIPTMNRFESLSQGNF